ncbi:uncharacterized protein LOC120356338 [Nilaparvata lugens]|uniref:uncharacterized protein LOC120356338 n=1 Tax=Nilaparvata lugens TaxID=108931 RepID=UPI00193DEE6A|nr:uncharacterized protein LOC120356338 [Nilaparvata lugens]
MKSTSISPTEVPDSNALASLSSLVNSLRSNLTNINNTLSSKLQWSSEDELRDSKLIQSLRDMTANLSARVTTLESKSNAKDLKTLQVNFDQFSLKIDGRFNDVNNKIGELQEKCSKLENNTAHLENTVNNMRLSYSMDSSAATTV